MLRDKGSALNFTSTNRSNIALNILLFIALSILTCSSLTLLYLLTPGPLDLEKTVIIERKISSDQIAKKLYSNDIIRYQPVFYMATKCYSLFYPIKSGEYLFNKAVSPIQVLRILASGKSVIHKLTIVEGSTVNDIINLLYDEKRLFGEIQSNVPEGFLMPSTYFISYGDQREQIIDQMRKNMSKALDEAMSQLSQDSPIKTRIELLILASIVEKEAAKDEERALISAVFTNRLRYGMKLQADPTTIYALTNGKGKLDRALTRSDCQLPLPYNTYYIKGLPPGPISCPGKKSLEAAAKPAKSNVLYFVSNNKGGHNFSSNIKDHNKYVQDYKKIRDQDINVKK